MVAIINITLFVVIQSLSRVRLFATPWTAACQAWSITVLNSKEFQKVKEPLGRWEHFLELHLKESGVNRGAFQERGLFLSWGEGKVPYASQILTAPPLNARFCDTHPTTPPQLQKTFPFKGAENTNCPGLDSCIH